ncbi:MAG TPA: UV DNA damage repair endonuclease UvsE [Planctomycetota bacterium]|nr:UV DNA damage repair endonuclease UvsE [Planctomycetota bacterium]
MRPLRLGFPVKVLARPDLKSHDTRRWKNGPHLRTSLACLDRILDHLREHEIAMYRMSSDLAPYATHPGMPRFHGMVAESAADLAAIGAKARAQGVRLSFHPSQYVLLNSADDRLTRQSIWDLSSQAEVLDSMGLDDEAVIVTHVGGVYDDHDASRARWIDGWNRCPAHVRRRLVLENDDMRFSAADVLWIHGHTGVRLVFDHQHFCCLNPEWLALRPTLEAFLRTWPAGTRPKIHFSSPRTELREVKRKVGAGERAAAGSGRTVAGQTTRKAVTATSRTKTVLLPPVWTGHADFTNPFEFATFMRAADGLDFDVMLEGKAKDLALMRLRIDLPRYAPDVAARFGLGAEAAARIAADEARLAIGVEAAADAEVDVDGGARAEADQILA